MKITGGTKHWRVEGHGDVTTTNRASDTWIRKLQWRYLNGVWDDIACVCNNRLATKRQVHGHCIVHPNCNGIGTWKYVDRQGARMRAVFKFPALASPVLGRDEICPCLQVRNTYDGTARIALHIGAFRFVCTNLAVGGGGVFAGGFVSIHAGEIPIEKMADQLAEQADLVEKWSPVCSG